MPVSIVLVLAVPSSKVLEKRPCPGMTRVSLRVTWCRLARLQMVEWCETGLGVTYLTLHVRYMYLINISFGV